MNRRRFLRSGAAAGATLGTLSPLGPAALADLLAPAAVHADPARQPRVASRQVPSGNIRDYLSLAAQRITTNALAEFTSAARFHQLRPEKHRQFLDMMGLDAWWPGPGTPPAVTVTGVVERPLYRLEKLHYESLPGLAVSANLYVPTRPDGRRPAVLYACGHARNQKHYYQAHARRFAELGFVCLLYETLEAEGSDGFHHGCYREGWWHWYSRGYTPAGIELLNGVRGLDLLAARPDVDPGRLGVTGISGGGAATWWIAAADPRVRVAAPVCGTATVQSHVHDRTVDGHCDCMWWINTRRWDLADVGALIAPRPLLIASADRDGLFTIESIREVHSQLARLYRRLGARDRLRLVETPGGHSYHERSRTEIFSWFLRHLAGRDLPPPSVGDIDTDPAHQESPATLAVYPGGSLPGNRITRVQDDFPVLARPPAIADAAALARERTRVIAGLRERSFAAFPSAPPPLDVQIEHEFAEDAAGHRFAFTAEEGWRLHGQYFTRRTDSSRAPVVVALCSPGEARLETRGRVLRLNPPVPGVALETRGVGDTAWSDDLNWHLRRAAAWTGRTLASLRVWDTWRGLDAVRTLPTVDPDAVSLLARGEMCVVALYAALLDGRVRTIVLEDPPATQNSPGRPDGRGPAIEMLGCLRVTDLPQVAGLLWPAELVLVGDVPETYSWADDLYRRLGSPGRVTRVRSLGAWHS